MPAPLSCHSVQSESTSMAPLSFKRVSAHPSIFLGAHPPISNWAASSQSRLNLLPWMLLPRLGQLLGPRHWISSSYPGESNSLRLDLVVGPSSMPTMRPSSHCKLCLTSLYLLSRSAMLSLWCICFGWVIKQLFQSVLLTIPSSHYLIYLTPSPCRMALKWSCQGLSILLGLDWLGTSNLCCNCPQWMVSEHWIMV